MGPIRVYAKSSAYILWFLTCSLWRTPNTGNGAVSNSVDCYWDPFFPTALPYSALICGLCQVLLYLVMLCSADIPGKIALFLWGGGVDPEERGDLGSIGGQHGVRKLVRM